MKSLTKLMLAVVLTIGSAVTAVANTAVAIVKPAYNTEDRHLSGFNAVEVAGSFDVIIMQSSTESVKVDAPANVLKRIVTEVKGGVLKIYTQKGDWNWDGDDHVVVHVSAKSLNSIALAGSGDVKFDGGIKGTSLALKLSGSGDVSGKVDVTNLETSIVGSGDIKVTGRAQNSVVKVAGSGDFTGTNLITTNTTVNVVGSGDARVNASQKVNAAIAGSGDVYYTGGATNISSSTSGSGDISKF
ncbi:DUF2807 domain-containing protein [Mucilaginibacter limnophilus]|uniref:DUF2807 domain-containing protein n=1 Tax=Mucilaginibacter limnophilus TaxID=1932778 RepID=A0A3S2XYU1_9SPHI|nr:head GIN domain-containing protein [Mucilaginibacter limnophilus]RVT98194.1 DUF2807 domain-containing protein [Mucilaginibacter limnophilus]